MSCSAVMAARVAGVRGKREKKKGPESRGLLLCGQAISKRNDNKGPLVTCLFFFSAMILNSGIGGIGGGMTLAFSLPSPLHLLSPPRPWLSLAVPNPTPVVTLSLFTAPKFQGYHRAVDTVPDSGPAGVVLLQAQWLARLDKACSNAERVRKKRREAKMMLYRDRPGGQPPGKGRVTAGNEARAHGTASVHTTVGGRGVSGEQGRSLAFQQSSEPSDGLAESGKSLRRILVRCVAVLFSV